MKIKLNYFTSTGNTAWVVSKLQSQFERNGIEVEIFDSVTSGQESILDCDMAGIIYPVWGSTLPNPQRKLISELPQGHGHKIFLIGNAGAFSGDTGIYWKKVLNKKGYDVVYAEHVFLPINSVFPGFSSFKQPSESKKLKMIEKAEERLSKSCDDILNGRRYFRGTGLIAKIGGGGQRNFYDPVVDKFKERMFIEPSICTNCRLCYKICPSGAISISADDDSLTIDTGKCIMCLKCYNLCPAHAALMAPESANTEKYTRYKGLDNSYKPIRYR